MSAIPIEIMVKRREELLRAIDTINAKVAEIDYWLGFAGHVTADERKDALATARDQRKNKNHKKS